MDSLQSFETLAVVNRVTSELCNYLDHNDNRTLAEYLIDLRIKCTSLKSFKVRLENSGSEFPESLIYSLDRFITKLHPHFTKSQQSHVKPKSPPRKLNRISRKRWRSPSLGAHQRKAQHICDEHQSASICPPVPRRRAKKEIDRWETQQLRAAGVQLNLDGLDRDANEVTGYEEEPEQDEEEEDVDIEVIEDEPTFLKGQTQRTLDLSPIRVIRVPDGSLNRAAAQGSGMTKELKELREVEMNEKASRKAPDSDAQGHTSLSKSRQPVATNRQSLRSMPVQIHADAQRKILGERTNLSIKQQQETLPVYKLKNTFLQAMHDHQTMIVVGETGSGKTTQMPRYLLSDEVLTRRSGIVACTQPRRVAAISVAERVAYEMGVQLGEEVGYSVRFDDRTSPSTMLKYCTDGFLVKEALLDPNLSQYSAIMLDEAHERTVSTDILFGLCKKALKRRRDLKLIVTSATLDAEKFSTYFDNAPILTVPGRTFPVEIHFARAPESDYFEPAMETIFFIHLEKELGDILVFLTGQEEIELAAQIITERTKKLGNKCPELIPIPVYSALPGDQQSRIFEPAPTGTRKCILATNIAETSITIDFIHYVVDCGFAKINTYDSKSGMERLILTPISQAQAKQRAGRAGRTNPGQAFRLYTEEAFETEMLPAPIPEIQRVNLENTVLSLKAMGIEDILAFDFMDPPPRAGVIAAFESLYALAALDDESLLTRLGRKMADFPLEPSASKILLSSVDLGCGIEAVSIISMLSADSNSPFLRPKERQQQADQRKARFHDPHSDHLTLLNLYNSWVRSGGSPAWCFENYVQARHMRRAKDVREQLVGIMQRHNYKLVSCGSATQLVRRAFCAGLFRHSARQDTQAGQGAFKTVLDETSVYIHPSSACMGKDAAYVIYSSLMETTKPWMHQITIIDPKWLVEAAPTFFKAAPTERMSRRKQAERIKPLYNKHAGEDEWRLSAQRRQGRSGGAGTWG